MDSILLGIPHLFHQGLQRVYILARGEQAVGALN